VERKHRGNKVIGGLIDAESLFVHLTNIQPALGAERPQTGRHFARFHSARLGMVCQHRGQRAIVAAKVEHVLKLPGHIFQPLNEMTRLPRFQKRIIVIMTGRPVAIAPVKRPVEELGWSW